ncbi:MAG: glycosyltransferase [Desulfomonile sp.]|nr:glycosyltransferase [Desulfomonile sp.]
MSWHMVAWAGAGFASFVLVALIYWGFLLRWNLKNEPQMAACPDNVSGDALPMVSVVVPAKDEQDYIEQSVVSILTSRYPNFELIVVNDRSRDRTAEKLERLSAEDSRLSVMTVEHLPDGWTGKTHALFQGARRASGELLLFTDADTVMTPDVLTRAVATLKENRLGMLSLLPGFLSHGFCETIVNPHLELGLGSVYQLKDVNDGARDVGLASGSFILVRRDLYEAVGTWERFRSEITEDVALSKAVKRRGDRLAVMRAGSLVKTRGFKDVGELCDFWKRIFYGAFDRSIFKILRVTANYLILSLLLLALIVSAAIALAGMATAPVWVMLGGSAAAIAALMAMFAVFTWKELGSWVVGLTAPVGIIVSTWVALNTLAFALGGRSIHWRGSSYK